MTKRKFLHCHRGGPAGSPGRDLRLLSANRTVQGAAVAVDGFDQGRDMLGRRELRNAVPEIEHMAHARIDRAEAVEQPVGLGGNGLGRGEQHGGVEIALECHFVTHAGTGAAQIGGPVQPQGVGAGIGHGLQPLAATLGEQNHRHVGRVGAGFERGDHSLAVGQGEGLEGAIGQNAAPGVEDHHGLGAGVDLRRQVLRHRLGVDRENAVHQIGAAVQQGLDGAVVVAAAAFDHVAGQRPRAAGKADERDALVAVLHQGAADLRHRVEHIAQFVHVLTEKIYGISNNQINTVSKTTNKPKRAEQKNIHFQTIQNSLLEKDVSEKNINKILKLISQYDAIVNESNKDEFIVSSLASLIPTSDFEFNENSGQKVISIVGPTGVGKTTCIAKLAVISKILHNLNIGLISIDTYRLGALDQLKIFSEISNIDFLVAYEPKDIPKFMKKFKDKDIVFIDTVGRSQNNTKLLLSINQFLKTVKIDETYLVLNSTSDYKIMLDVAKKFKVLNYNGIIFSKLDEAVSFGNLFNLVEEVKTPIKYLTNGQVIPDDIIAADSEFIANMIYTGKIN